MTTWMWRELHEGPDRIAQLLPALDADLDPLVTRVRAARPSWAMLVARGTSDRAAAYGRYLIETELGIPCGLAAPSVVTVYGARLEWIGGLVIGVSQSGRSPDLVTVVETARAGGAFTVAVTNDPGSPLAERAAFTIDCRAGMEQSVAATKTYLAELVALAALVGRLADRSDFSTGLSALPDALRVALQAGAAWVECSGVVDELAALDRVLVASRGFELSTALEIALKLEEVAGIFAAGHSTADLEHGPIALAGARTAALVIRPGGAMGPAIDAALERLRRAGSQPWLIAREGVESGPRTLCLPADIPPMLQPVTSVVPGELLAEAVARRRGLDPDAPPGLTKVTLTR